MSRRQGRYLIPPSQRPERSGLLPGILRAAAQPPPAPPELTLAWKEGMVAIVIKLPNGALPFPMDPKKARELGVAILDAANQAECIGEGTPVDDEPPPVAEAVTDSPVESCAVTDAPSHILLR